LKGVPKITSRKTPFEAANRAKAGFCSAEPELRTPLTGILGFTSILLRTNFGPLMPSKSNILMASLAVTKQLLELINDLLDLTKIEAGKED